MHITTKHFSIDLVNRFNVTNKTKFIPIPREILAFHGSKVFFPDPATMEDICTCHITSHVNPVDGTAAADAFGHVGANTTRHPSDQPNRLIGYMVALYKCLLVVKRRDTRDNTRHLDQLVADLDAAFANNKYLSRLAKFWEHRYIDAPGMLSSDMSQAHGKKGK